LSKTQVAALINQFIKIPPVKRTDIDLKIERAQAAAALIRRTIVQIPGKVVSVQVTQNGTVQRVQREIDSITGKTVFVQVGLVRGSDRSPRAGGGWLTGGVAGKDSIPLASGDIGMPGEFIVNRRDARANASLLEAVNAGRRGMSLGGVLASAAGSAAPAAAGGGGVSAAAVGAAVRAALAGMSIRFDGDGLARLVSGRQAYAAAAGGRR
jgi:hypothetical protein